MKMIHEVCPGHPEAKLEGYILDCAITLGQEKARPAVLVCPGGGYVYCSPREAEPVALRYAAKGFHAFILRYSTGRNCAGFAPLKEVSWVIGYLREHAEEWNITPNKIVTCGFSAGGHLAMAAGVLAENKPNAMILGYPMTACPNMPGMNYVLKLLTGKEDVTDEDAVPFELVHQINADTPPVFLAATAEDMLTTFGALPVANAYSRLRKGYELHVFQFGPHGYSLANEVTADGSSQVIDESFEKWQELSVKWLHRTFGKPEFVNKSTSKMGQYLKELGVERPGQGGTSYA